VYSHAIDEEVEEEFNRDSDDDWDEDDEAKGSLYVLRFISTYGGEAVEKEEES
jgi:hypothetical protein